MTALAVALLATGARADVYTQSADWQRSAFTPAAPEYQNLNYVNIAGGAIYSNTNGTFVQGTNFVSVGALPIQQLNQIGGGTSTNVTGNINTQAIAVFALAGTLETVGLPAVTSVVQTGQLWVFQNTEGTFNTLAPASWITGSVVAKFQLKDPEAVLNGNPNVQPVNLPSNVVNRIGTNDINTNNLAGSALFRSIDAGGNSPLFDDVSNLGIPAGQVTKDIALIINNLGESINFINPQNFQPVDGVTSLNVIAGLLGLGNLGGAGTGFATGYDVAGYSGNSLYYSPLAGLATAADFSSALTGGQGIAGRQVGPQQQDNGVPEPTTLALLGLAAGAALGYRQVRRSRRS